MLSRQFNAKVAEDTERYLGVVVTDSNRQNDLTHNLLVDKLYSKLSGWKINMLSLAGRVALIKSVLVSIPVYYMSVAALPAKTVKDINSVLRRFLWGKTGTERYIAFISWKKICGSTETGGLAIRDIKNFNQALLLKLVWQLASGADKLWVQIFRAKYFTKIGFWAVKRRSDASPLWRAIQDLKGVFSGQLQWHVGQGGNIRIMNEPWYQGWEVQSITSNAQRDTKIADVYDPNHNSWNSEKIEGLMGTQAFQSIIATAPMPSRDPLVHDRLLWTVSKSGRYSTKEGYQFLRSTPPVSVDYQEEPQ